MYMGKIGQKSAAFINHKPFHPGSFRNLEKVWIAEQKHIETQRKQKELLEQRQQESKIDELRKALRIGEQTGNNSSSIRWVSGNEGGHAVGLEGLPTHLAREVSDNKLEWMYQQNSSEGQEAEQEKYLLGEKTVSEARDADVKTIKDLQSGNLAGSALREAAPVGVSKNDFLRKMHEDPMYMVKLAEAQHKKTVENNPILRARMLEEQEAKEEEAERRREIRRMEREAARLERKAEARRRKYEEHGARKRRREPGSDSDERRRRPRLEDDRREWYRQDATTSSRRYRPNEDQYRDDYVRLGRRRSSDNGRPDSHERDRNSQRQRTTSPTVAAAACDGCSTREQRGSADKVSRGPQADAYKVRQLRREAQMREDIELGPPLEMMESMERRRQEVIENGSMVSGFHRSGVERHAQQLEQQRNGQYLSQRYQDSRARTEEARQRRPLTLDEMKEGARKHEANKRERLRRTEEIEDLVEQAERRLAAKQDPHNPSLVLHTRRSAMEQIDRAHSLRDRKHDSSFFD